MTKLFDEKFDLVTGLEQNGIIIKMINFNPNPKTTAHDQGDCATRMICRLTNEPYMKIFNKQIDLAKEICSGSNNRHITKQILAEYGYKFSATYGCLLVSFILNNMHGRYGIVLDHHAFTVINGKIYDSIICNNRKYISQARRHKLNHLLQSRMDGYFYLPKKK